MRVSNYTLKIVVALLLVAAFLPGCRSMTGRSVGRVIDDKTITAQVKSKLVAEKASNLTRIGVTTVNGVVYLDGAVDSVDHKVHAEELARRIEGVANVVNNIQVSAAGSPPTSGSASPR
jgi:hyperosmotically inducible periplasmic protein